ncbi:uncharacterized protein LOC123444017 [Hordeum vulgare subsp. vulgare]|nr:uncharacterized protein LOC123444017 [Hordeum vulgare subsp. vulgare]KAI4999502.1 hypothetical protein ZWY2020_004091 [Hordeum vulgare]BAJ93793.1 predicted protein [Hordeum vulgare subsp. vulgare]
MPRARRPRREWSDGVPPELLGVIFLDLACLADRVYFAAVCRSWRSVARAAGGPPAPRQLPWLLLPSSDKPSFFSLHSGAKRCLRLPESVRGARLCGSHDGGWVALAFEQWRGYAAVNLLSGARVLLPDRLRTALPHPFGPHANTACEHHMVIRAITFSGSPSAEDCLAAAHVSSASNIAFWRQGMNRHWITCGVALDVIQDIIYYENGLKQGFHVLSKTEDIVVYSPNADKGAPLVMTRTSYQVQERADILRRKSRIVSRYLVESRGKLLMILRLAKGGKNGFRIFEMNLVIAPDGGSEASWVELHSLPGRVLLLGRGCSRAVEVSQFNRLQLGSIYYLDDTSFDISLALSSGSKYYSTDMGVYGRKTLNRARSVRRFPRKCTSEGSPPIWFMP